jgi:hypothetical protein
MTSLIPVTKDLDNQQPVPTVWRDTLARVGERIARGAYRFADIEGVVPITERLAESFAYNIEAYGEPLADLKDATWSTSVCMWQDGYWGVLLDLFTQSGRCDLIMDVRVDEDLTAPLGYRFDIRGVYVP